MVDIQPAGPVPSLTRDGVGPGTNPHQLGPHLSRAIRQVLLSRMGRTRRGKYQ